MLKNELIKYKVPVKIQSIQTHAKMIIKKPSHNCLCISNRLHFQAGASLALNMYFSMKQMYSIGSILIKLIFCIHDELQAPALLSKIGLIRKTFKISSWDFRNAIYDGALGKSVSPKNSSISSSDMECKFIDGLHLSSFITVLTRFF